MESKDTSKKPDEKGKALRAFLIHLIIFAVVNLLLLIVPVFYDGKLVFDFEERGPMLYGSIGWGVGLIIHGAVVFVDRIVSSSKD